MSAWLWAFGATLVLESVVVLCFAPANQRGRWLTIALLLNGLTHPLASWAHADGAWDVWLVEGGVWAVEALGYRFLGQFSWSRALLYSLATNATSAGAAGLGLLTRL